MPGESMITINDIANRAGVAPSTVSRVLSGNGYSGKKTRDLVLRIADDLAVVLARPFALQLFHPLLYAAFRVDQSFACITHESSVRE